MPDYQVSAAYIDALLRQVRESGRLAEVSAVDARVTQLINNLWSETLHPGELHEVLADAVVQVFGATVYEEMTYQSMKQRFGGIVLPMIKSSLSSGPATVFTRLDGMVKVALKGIQPEFAPDGDHAGVLIINYPRAVTPNMLASWRGVIRYVFEVTQTTTGVLEAAQQSPDGRILEYRVTWR